MRSGGRETASSEATRDRPQENDAEEAQVSEEVQRVGETLVREASSVEQTGFSTYAMCDCEQKQE